MVAVDTDARVGALLSDTDVEEGDEEAFADALDDALLDSVRQALR